MPRRLTLAVILCAVPAAARGQSPPPPAADGAATGTPRAVQPSAGAAPAAPEATGNGPVAQEMRFEAATDPPRRRSKPRRVASAGTEIGISRSAPAGDANEFTTQLGLQTSLGGNTPAGFKLFFDYARRLGYLVWLDFQVNTMFGVGPVHGTCYDGTGHAFDCGGAVDANGHAIDVLAGIKLRFPVRRAPLIPYVGVNGGVVAVYDRPARDNGAAVVARMGGGIRYFPTRHVGIGGEVALTLGPAFYSDTCSDCNDSHVAFYRAFDFSTGVEFLF
jgi:hypothetical protein